MWQCECLWTGKKKSNLPGSVLLFFFQNDACLSLWELLPTLDIPDLCWIRHSGMPKLTKKMGKVVNFPFFPQNR